MSGPFCKIFYLQLVSRYRCFYSRCFSNLCIYIKGVIIILFVLSVHFEADKEGHTIAHVHSDEKGEEEVEIADGKTTEESMNEIVDAQKRQLDQWCFAEHYENKVLLQVSLLFIDNNLAFCP